MDGIYSGVQGGDQRTDLRAERADASQPFQIPSSLDQLVRALYPDGLNLDRIRRGEIDDIVLLRERDDRIFSRGQSRRE